MKKNVSQLKWGTTLSYLSMGISMAIGLIYTPFMIQRLGQNEYGLYNIVASTVGMLSLLNLGFSSGYIRYFAKYKKNNDNNSIYRLNGVFLLIFTIIGLIALICGLFMAFNLDLFFDKGFTAEEYSTARILTILMTVSTSLAFPMSVFGNIINANERFLFLRLIGIITTVIGPLVNIPILLMGYKAVALVISSLVFSIIHYAINAYYVLVVLKNKFIFSNFEKGIFAGLFGYTIFIAINMIIDQINWNIDKMLLGRFKGTAAAAVYSVGFALYTHYMSFSTAISGVFTPRIHHIVNSTENDEACQKKELTELFIKVGRIQFLLLGLLASGIFFFGKNFILNYWAGEGYEDSYYVALLLIFPASIALIQNLGIEIQRAKNIHQFRAVAYLVMALVNLGLSIYLCQLYGPIGSAIGTAISLVLANGLIMNIYYHKKCNIDIIAFWKEIIKFIPAMAIPIVFGIIQNRFFLSTGKIAFISSVLIYTVVYCLSMWLLGMNTYEKGLIKTPLRKVLVRRKAK